MSDAAALFALADADDAPALLDKLGKRAVPVVNDNGETLFLYCTYRGKAKCGEALSARGGLTIQEAAAAGDVRRIEECTAVAPWTLQTLSGDGWTALHLAAFLGREAAAARLIELGASARQWGRAFDANLPLHAACAGRRLGRKAFEGLIAATGDPDVAMRGAGFTPLMIAAGNN